MAVDEEDGGAAVSMVGIAGLIEEVGRHALPSPMIATLCAALVLRAAGGGEARALLQRIAAGATASLAITPETGSWEPDDCEVVASQEPARRAGRRLKAF